MSGFRVIESRLAQGPVQPSSAAACILSNWAIASSIAMPDQGTSAQRIRIGLTGLAFAFLLVLLGSVISRSSRDGQVNSVEQAGTNEPSEPLADLGVAPGAPEASNNSSSKQ